MYLDKLHKESERENSLNKLLGVLYESVNGNYNYLARKPVDSRSSQSNLSWLDLSQLNNLVDCNHFTDHLVRCYLPLNNTLADYPREKFPYWVDKTKL